MMKGIVRVEDKGGGARRENCWYEKANKLIISRGDRARATYVVAN